jgi:hypothetical protein
MEILCASDKKPLFARLIVNLDVRYCTIRNVIDVPMQPMYSSHMRCWNGYRLLSRHNRLDGTSSLFLLLHSFHSQRLLFLYCSLVSPVISCFLLSSTGKFMWKYGEVHMSVLGSAPIRTGKFTSCVRGSSSQITVFRSPILYKRMGKFT